jgi:hypothetical protein
MTLFSPIISNGSHQKQPSQSQQVHSFIGNFKEIPDDDNGFGSIGGGGRNVSDD